MPRSAAELSGSPEAAQTLGIDHLPIATKALRGDNANASPSRARSCVTRASSFREPALDLDAKLRCMRAEITKLQQRLRPRALRHADRSRRYLGHRRDGMKEGNPQSHTDGGLHKRPRSRRAVLGTPP